MGPEQNATITKPEASPARGERHARVAIVGGGPTGVLLAIDLARRGIDVRIFDKGPTRSPESRAIGIHARTLEVFHQLGIVEEFLALGHRVAGLTVHTRARRGTRVRLSGLDSPYPFLLTLGQDETQRILDERLAGLGVAIERATQVLDLEQDGDAVELRLADPGGSQRRTVRADWVVGCDGAHSIVRRCLGVPFEGADYGQDWLMTEVNVNSPLVRDEFHVFSYSAAPLVAFPLPRDRWRLFLPQVPNREGERPPPEMEEIERVVAQRGPAHMKLSDPSLLAAFRCYRRSTPTMRHGRVLVAGDAAHIHSPAGGQGLNTGLQDAFNLGWKLALVADGGAPQELLDTYGAERVPIADGVLQLTHGLVKIFTISSPRKRWLRDRLLPAVMAVPAAERRYTARLAQLSLGYRGGPLAPPSARSERRSPAAGDRLSPVSGLSFRGDAVSTLDLLDSSRHTLFILTGEHEDRAARNDAVARLARFSGVLRIVHVAAQRATDDSDAVADPGLRAHRRYRARRGQLLLVRPDGYLACRAPLRRPEIAERYLDHLIAGPRMVRASV